jgi:hypothetical protein
MSEPYLDPVKKLLTFGDPRNFKAWPDYLELGFMDRHVPDLIRMASDPGLHSADSESLEVWAPVHAWRTLGQLQADRAVDALLALWQDAGADEGYDDWLLDDMPHALALIGAPAIPALKAYLLNLDNDEQARAAAAYTFRLMGNQYPDLRERSVSILAAALERYQENSAVLNGSLAADLVDLNAVEAASVIKAAYYARKVDLLVQGQWSDVAEQLHLDPASVPGPDPAPEDMEAAWEKVLGMPRSRLVETFDRAFGEGNFAGPPQQQALEPGLYGDRAPGASFHSSLERMTGFPERTHRSRRHQSTRKAKRKQEKKSRRQNR